MPAAVKNTIQIRGAGPDDVSSLVVLEKQSRGAAHWEESFYRGLFDEGAAERISLVAEDEGKLAGFLIARVTGDECELENVVVAEGRRRRGIGSSLIQRLVDVLRNRNGAGIFLEVRESNAAARALYEKSGFRIKGRRKSYYNDPQEDAVVYGCAP